jgi:hypothetical protein
MLCVFTKKGKSKSTDGFLTHIYRVMRWGICLYIHLFIGMERKPFLCKRSRKQLQSSLEQKDSSPQFALAKQNSSGHRIDCCENRRNIIRSSCQCMKIWEWRFLTEGDFQIRINLLKNNRWLMEGLWRQRNLKEKIFEKKYFSPMKPRNETTCSHLL